MIGWLTLSDEVPPGAVERVVGAPAGYIRTICRTGVVLVLESGTEFHLVVEPREGVDIARPTVGFINDLSSKCRPWNLRVSVEHLKRLYRYK